MSYFTTIRCNDWDLEEALNPYLTDSEDENEAYRKLKRQLLDLVTNISINSLAKKKVGLLLKKLPSVESTSSTTDSAIISITMERESMTSLTLLVVKIQIL